MEAVPAVSSSAERSSQNPLISLAPRLYTISHPNKCSKLENDEISGLANRRDDSRCRSLSERRRCRSQRAGTLESSRRLVPDIWWQTPLPERYVRRTHRLVLVL